LGVQFSILGPLEVTVGGQSVVIGGTRQQTVLALLLLDANRPVTIERLVDAAYDDDPPATARAQVQISISTLRRLLTEPGQGTIIATRSRGYSIEVIGQQLDAQRFHDLILVARSARDGQRPEEAVATYRKALGLWRGSPLEGIDSRVVRAAADRLDESRLMSTEDCIQLELDLGRHHEVIGELTELVEAHPLRERHRGLLMTALHRCGRDAEALEVYRAARRMMIEELGIEPPKRLQQMERAILTDDGSLDPPRGNPDPEPAARPGVPRMLPTDIADFTDRVSQVEEIRPRSTSRIASPETFLMASCSRTCTGAPFLRSRRRACWSDSCGSSACPATHCPTAWRSERRYSVRCSPSAA
jgi:DNA-binding SARP family transcriptional activator